MKATVFFAKGLRRKSLVDFELQGWVAVLLCGIAGAALTQGLETTSALGCGSLGRCAFPAQVSQRNPFLLLTADPFTQLPRLLCYS